MTFESILFASPGDRAGLDTAAEPAFFADLRLDQVVAAIVAGREEYDLARFFWLPLRRADAVRYRHEVLRDLARDPIRAAVVAFETGMRAMRSHLGQSRKLPYRHQDEIWFLDAVAIYCDSVAALARDLAEAGPESRGLGGLAGYLADYVGSDGFAAFAGETRALVAELAGVTYSVHIRGGRVRVLPFAGEADYSAEVQATFARFERETAREPTIRPASTGDMDHVEARVLEGVARLHPVLFRRLGEHAVRHARYLDDTIAMFDREVQLLLAVLEHLARFEAAGLAVCLPDIVDGPQELCASSAFDLALADRLVPHSAVVCNDYHLSGPERILVVTGPNQGGKTTFARAVGQLHHLARIGCPVPAREAHISLPDAILTHFERTEDVASLRGKLEDELVRIHAILEQATAASLVILNESFTSTTLADSLLLGSEVIRQLAEQGPLVVCVTFVDELAALGPATVSMVATVSPDDPAVRTFRIARRPADGLAHAAAIAAKHGLTYERMRARLDR